MTEPSQRLVLTISGGLVAMLGLCVLAGWALDIPALKTVLPGLVSMKVNTALCFLLTGTALALHDAPAAGRRRAAIALALIAVSIAAATLAEYLLALNLGIDEWLFRDPDTPATLYPGRIPAAAACGFVAAGLVLVLRQSVFRPSGVDTLCRALALGLIALGIINFMAYLFTLRFLVSALPFRTIAVHTALGFAVLGTGLLVASARHQPAGDDRRIAGLAALLLVLAAASTGIASFTIIGAQVHKTLAQGLALGLEANVNIIATNVALRTTRAEIIASRTKLLEQLRRLHSDPGLAESRAEMREVLDSLMTHGFSGIAVSLPTENEIIRGGTLVGAPSLEVRLTGGGDRSLLWQDGIYLRTRLPLSDARGLLGTVLAEQPMPALVDILRAVDTPWSSAEFLLCNRNAAALSCFPSRFNASPFQIPPAAAAKRARLADRAVHEARGFGDALDYRNQEVLGAFSRVADLGLVAVLKVDAGEIYAPVTRLFGLALALIALLATLGALLVRWRVRPLATALETRVRERTVQLDDANAELRRVIDESRDSEARFRALFEGLPVSAVVFEPDSLRIVSFNNAAARTLGYTREEFAQLRMSDIEAVHDDALIAANAKRLSAGETMEFESKHRTRAGDLRDTLIHGQPIEIGGRRLTLAIFTDITARKAAAAARRESEARRLMSAVVEYATDAVLTVTRHGLVTSWNSAAEKVYGYTAEEMIGAHISRLVPEDRREEAAALLSRAGRGEHTELLETRRRHKDGRLLDIALTVSPIRDEHGGVTGASSISRDIGEKKRADQALMDNEARLRELTAALEHNVRERSADNEFLLALLDNVHDGIIACDGEGVLTLFNRAMREFHGPPQEPLSPERWAGHYDLYLADGLTPMRTADIPLFRAFKGEPVRDVEMVIVSKRGEPRTLLASGQAFHDADGRTLGAVVSMHDITERKRQEVRIAAALKEKETLLKEVYHRVKNNLQVIQSLLNLRARALPEGLARTAMSETAARVRAMALVHEKLYQSGNLAVILLSDYLRDLLRQLIEATGATERCITLSQNVEVVETNLETAIPLGLIVNELVSNSLKHAFPDGRAGNVIVSLRRHDGGLTLAVADDGIGMPPDYDLERAASMGLKLATSLARQLGGKLVIEADNGTRFSVEIKTLTP